MMELLDEESERGCVLVAASYIDAAFANLTRMKCKRLSNCSESELNKLFKDHESQFYSFTSCIRLARAIGLITEDEQDMLVRFSHKRNEFAHKTGRKSITDKWLANFTKPLAKSLEAALALDWQFRHKPARQKFMYWAALMHGMAIHRFDKLAYISSSSSAGSSKLN